MSAPGRPLEVVGQLVDRLGHDRVQHRVREGERHARPERAELELVPGEGERRGAVAVAAVARKRRQHRRAEPEERARRVRVALTGRDRLEDLLELGAQEDRDDRRRRLVRAQAVVLADGRHRCPEQALVLVHRLDHGRAEEQEVDVLRRAVAGLEQVPARVRAHRPVVVLAGAVHARERLLVQQADQPVLAGHAHHELHGQLLVVRAHVRVLEHRRQLVLARAPPRCGGS